MSAPRRIREIALQGDYDIVHVHTPIASFLTRYALRHLRRSGRPQVIYTAHGFHFYQGSPAYRSLPFQALETLAGRWTDYLVVINREDEAAARRFRLVPEDRILYMPGIGVDTAYYNSAKLSESDVRGKRREIGLPDAASMILVIAEFIPRKRHADILKAFARIQPRDARLALAGGGRLEEETKQLARSLGIEDRVLFLGWRRDIPALIRCAACLVLASTHEGLPRSVMEAMSAGVPVIGSDIRGVRDLLDADRGLLFPTGNVEALAKAMAWTLDHPREARAIGQRGRESMGDYDLRRVIRLHETLYEKALEGQALPSLREMRSPL
jgi:glycosyltransferase involved in cell wall biosynthesis